MAGERPGLDQRAEIGHEPVVPSHQLVELTSAEIVLVVENGRHPRRRNSSASSAASAGFPGQEELGQTAKAVVEVGSRRGPGRGAP